MGLKIISGDITKLETDAIVNAANTGLKQGGGVCGAIFNAAGARELQKACDVLAPIETGEAVITPGFNLPARYVIHTAGPVYNSAAMKESERLLRDSYTNSLKLAKENNLSSIAFPLISSGIYGYPLEEAYKVAVDAIEKFLKTNDMDVSLVIFDVRTLNYLKSIGR